MSGSWGTESEPGACPDAELLVELASGRLAPPARAGVLAHVQACPECAQVLAAFTRSIAAPLPIQTPQAPGFLGGHPQTPPKGPGFGGLTPSGTLKLAANDPRLVPSGSHRLSGAGPAAGYVKPGDVLAGKYRVERIIGLGGMGVVVAATHLQLGQGVALKLMLPQAFASPDANERFLREAQAAVQIQGEHVARVTDVGTLESGAPFMVMELLRGMDLSRVLLARGGLPLDEAVDYVLQACEALAEAHGIGIIHRDLKPANLFLAERPDGSTTIKVLDFGISKANKPGVNMNLTHTQSVMGTPRYMSPEQMRSTKMVGRATDVWALGCILYELLVARPAFDGESPQALAIAIAQDPAPAVRATRPDIRADVDRVIARCLEKDVARRVASVEELARLLAPFAPKRAEVALERIERLARLSQRPPGQSIAFAATVASVPVPEIPGGVASGGAKEGLMTDRGFARSNPQAPGLARSKVPFGLLGAAAIAAAGGLWWYVHSVSVNRLAEQTRAAATDSGATAAAVSSAATAAATMTVAVTATPPATATVATAVTSTPTAAAPTSSVAPRGFGGVPQETRAGVVAKPRPRPRPAPPPQDDSSHDLDDRK